jgi:hypothetical protein
LDVNAPKINFKKKIQPLVSTDAPQKILIKKGATIGDTFYRQKNKN